LLHLAEARDGWTSKQDLIQVFGLRKVYKLSGGRKWWQVWRQRPQPKQQQQQQQEAQQYVAVADSWFGVPKGQLLCLLGPNGAGKTTSINCLIGEWRM
jgi:ABC-type multidrug transport system ATPase subunit